MHSSFVKTTLLGVAILFRVMTSWSQTPTPTCTDDTWTATNTIDAPTKRYGHTAVWTGTEMIVWGGYDNNYLDTGGRYDPAKDNWTATSTIDATSARYGHTAVWTGTEMIVWGGNRAFPDVTYFNTGGKYKPGTNSWTATTIANAPVGRWY